MFQVLQELQKCKRIPKADRLELRQKIKQGNPFLVQLFTTLPLEQLQKQLRKYIAKEKADKQNQKVRAYIQENLNTSHYKSKAVKKQKEVFSNKFQQDKQKQFRIESDEQLLEPVQNRKLTKQLKKHHNDQIDRLPEQPFQIFKGQEPEEVMRYFFIGEPKINRQTFIFRLEQYSKAQGYWFSEQVLDSYFDLLLRKGTSNLIQSKQLDISAFGDAIQPYVVIIPNKIRDIFGRLDRQEWGYVSKYCLEGPEWLSLFNRANYNNRATISYWELYAIRNTVEYLIFQQWFNSK